MSRLVVVRPVLEVARVFFEERGRRGLEGTAMLAGPDRAITRCVVPHQIGRRSTAGVSVEVTLRGKLALAAALAPGETYHARIHSHPHEAFHSITDDENPGLTADRALSIVVPDFGRGLRDGLTACAVYERRDARWVRLNDYELNERLAVTA
jgi:hypothetical protein